jgi:hypothetical protein
VHVDGSGFGHPTARDSLLDQAERYLADLEHVLAAPHDHVEHQAWRYREGLLERIQQTRGVIARRRDQP